ncbi:MAG: response regulator [Deltaproteobacteria bacterium]|nr:response regulator [Deltaproteobacteria bacterium]
MLLVEDNPDHAFLARVALQKRPEIGEVEVCEDAGSTRERLSRDPLPDAILMDLRLPGEGGLELLSSVRQEPRTRDLPVVVLSTSPRESEISQSLAMGASGYLTKPIDVDAFLARIEAAAHVLAG